MGFRFFVSICTVTGASGKGVAYTFVTAEGIDGPRASVESSLADEERRETHTCL